MRGISLTITTKTKARPYYNNKGKGQVMIVSTSANVLIRVMEEPNLDSMADQVQNLFKFKHLYEQMDFSQEQRLAVTESIIELTDPSKAASWSRRDQEKLIDSVTTQLCFMKMNDAISQATTTSHFILQRV